MKTLQFWLFILSLNLKTFPTKSHPRNTIRTRQSEQNGAISKKGNYFSKWQFSFSLWHWCWSLSKSLLSRWCVHQRIRVLTRAFLTFISLSRASSTQGRDATSPAEPELIRFLQYKLSLLLTGQDAAPPPSRLLGRKYPCLKCLFSCLKPHFDIMVQFVGIFELFQNIFTRGRTTWDAMQEDPHNRAISSIQLIRIERFHSRGQHLCKFIGTKESVYIWKEFNSHKIDLEHQHGRRFVVLEHQNGRYDVMWKRCIHQLVFI